MEASDIRKTMTQEEIDRLLAKEAEEAYHDRFTSGADEFITGNAAYDWAKKQKAQKKPMKKSFDEIEEVQ